jgi:hypothetical protein
LFTKALLRRLKENFVTYGENCYDDGGADLECGAAAASDPSLRPFYKRRLDSVTGRDHVPATTTVHTQKKGQPFFELASESMRKFVERLNAS